MKKTAPKLSIIIHTKNEERQIAECIESCRSLASEILVVDMKSIDNTVRIAKKLGARIIKVPDYGYVEPARQAALKAAKGEWIFLLDADERVTPSLAREILRKIQSKKSMDIYSIPSKNIFLGTWLKHAMRWPDRHIRLFKKGTVTWSSEIHSQAVLASEPQNFPASAKHAILHHHSTSVQEIARKTLQQAQSEKYYQQQNVISSKLVNNRIHHELFWRFIEHKGYEDGIPGYISAKFMEYYRFLEFASYWEQHKDIAFTEDELRQLATPPLPILLRQLKAALTIPCKKFLRKFI